MAYIEVINLNPVDFAAAGYIGEPGHREFYIQGSKSGITKSVLVEKQQLEHISSEAINFLNVLSNDFGQEDLATPSDFDNAELIYPIETPFRARSISIIFDELTQYLTLVLRESDLETGNEFDENVQFENEFSVVKESDIDDKVLRLTMSRTQMRALAVKGNLSIGQGRETCQLCFLPKDPTNHICRRMN